MTDLIFAITGEMQDGMFQALLQAEEEGIEVTTMPMVYEDLLGRVPISLLRSDWILRSFVDQARADGLYELGKRLIDIIGGLVGRVGAGADHAISRAGNSARIGLAGFLLPEPAGETWPRIQDYQVPHDARGI